MTDLIAQMTWTDIVLATAIGGTLGVLLTVGLLGWWVGRTCPDRLEDLNHG